MLYFGCLVLHRNLLDTCLSTYLQNCLCHIDLDDFVAKNKVEKRKKL